MVERFKRVLVKLSGEALAGEQEWLDSKLLADLAIDLANAAEDGFELAIVSGGGNILRGARLSEEGIVDRPTADAMGMLATVINTLALESALTKAGVQSRTMSAVPMPSICETFSRQKALTHLNKKRIVLVAGGTGQPYFTTDTGAVLRASELQCNAVLKATQVDGVYTSDPMKDRNARRFQNLTHDECLAMDIKVMDAAAFALAKESGLSILVGSVHAPSSVTSILQGNSPATVIKP
jgi:uridylate kinase